MDTSRKSLLRGVAEECKFSRRELEQLHFWFNEGHTQVGRTMCIYCTVRTYICVNGY